MRIHSHPRGARPGFLLVEILLGIAVFSIFVMAIGYTLLYGQENTIASGDRIRAVYHTEKIIDATRAIRDASFSSVTTGQHGIDLNSSGKWTFSGSVTTATGLFLTDVTVTQLASDWVGLSAHTDWRRGYNRSGSVLLTTELTDWRSARSIGNWSSLTTDGTYDAGGNVLFTDMATYSGTYAFVTARNTTGLYVLDTSTTTAPVRINDTFSLGYAAHEVAVRGSVMFVLTDDSTQEIRAYSISNPSSFSSSNLLATYNLPGSARARAIAITGDTMYVGASVSGTAGEDEFYAFRVNGSGSITLLDSVDESGTVESIALSGTAAYLSSSIDSSELRVINVESGSNLVALGGYNLSDRTLDGVSVAVSGTATLLGTLKGTSIEELVLFNTETAALPTSTTSVFEGSGGLLGLDIDPRQCVAFMGIDSNKRALQVARIRTIGSPTSLATYNSTTGKGRNVFYDMKRDRLFLLTEQAVVIFRPGTATGTCP